jgi:hypothetical protein
MPQDPYAAIAESSADPYAAIASSSSLDLKDARTVPNARIRNIPNPAANETSPGEALYHGAKTGFTLGMIPAAPGMIGAPLETAVGLGGAGVGAATGKVAAKAAGAGAFGQEVGEDVGGLAGGVVAGGAAGWARAKVKTIYDLLPEAAQKELLGFLSPRVKHLLNFADALGAAKAAPVAAPAAQPVDPAVVSPSRSLPGQISPEVVRPPAAAAPAPAAPIPPRTGLQLSGEVAAAAPPAPAAAEAPVPASNFPPPGPRTKFTYDPAKVPTGPRTPRGPSFDTDTDAAIEDAMRADLARHGTIAKVQAGREAAANNTVDVPKGTQVQQAKNTQLGPQLADLGASSIGSPSEPVEFVAGQKAFKSGGQWFVKGGDYPADSWTRVSNSQFRSTLEGLNKTAAPAAAPTPAKPTAAAPASAEDLSGEWQKSVDFVKAKKAAR